MANWQAWAEEFRERAAENDGYVTLSVYPPRRRIVAAMRPFMAGVA